ncbi:MAG: molecular chaperone HscC [Lawsonibacter sp.]|nr:molecular chaperone HscC [Lawsonibacter sp.]
MVIIGIDLGTTNSLAAVWRGGRSELIPNAAGEYLTPSVVSVDEDGSILVGAAARDRLISHPERTAAGFKRSMGSSRRYELGGKSFTAEDLSAFVLRRLREDAESYLGEVVEEAVISVPAYFAEAQRAATKRAGALAGLTVERLVNEPSAAAVAGHIGEGDQDKLCLVFDFGGGTLDVSLVERFDNVVSVTAVSGDNHLGGRDFDESIARGFCEDCGLDFDALPRQRQESLRRQAESCKMALTSRESVIMAVSDEEISASLVLTNEWLIRKSSALFQRVLAPVRKVFLDASLSAGDLDELVMVGGSSRMPAVRRYIARALQREPAAGAQPDTAIAVGAGICAGMKARVRDLRELVLTDVCPFTLGIATLNHAEQSRDLMSPIIERNSVLPTSKEGVYYTAYDGQKAIEVKVYQGEQRYCGDNTYLGCLEIAVPPAPRGQQSIRVRFTYDINGLLEVEVAGKDGQQARLVLQGSGMSEQEVAQRLKELSSLKLHPREQEGPRNLIARGQRLYAMTVGSMREQVAQILDWFQGELVSQESIRIAKACRKVDAFFDRVEAYVGQADLPEPEDGPEEEA